jgi:VRR-NUC domain
MRLIKVDTVADLKERRTKRRLARRRIMADVPTEDQEQIKLFHWADVAERHTPALKLLFSIANEGGRLKNLHYAGVKRGVPDIFLAWPRTPYAGLFIELKRLKGGKVAPEQYSWLGALNAAGYATRVAYGADEARTIIVDYLQGAEHEQPRR